MSPPGQRCSPAPGRVTAHLGIELVDINKIGIPVNEYFDELIKSGQYLLEERVIQIREYTLSEKELYDGMRCLHFVNPLHWSLKTFLFYPGTWH